MLGADCTISVLATELFLRPLVIQRRVTYDYEPLSYAKLCLDQAMGDNVTHGEVQDAYGTVARELNRG